MNSYETVFILTPVLSDDQAKEAVQKFESEVSSLGGKIKHSESWGLKKLAYPIQKKSTGFYFLMEFEGPGSVVAELELTFIPSINSNYSYNVHLFFVNYNFLRIISGMGKIQSAN